MNRSRLGEGSLSFAKRLGDLKRMRGRIRIVVLAGTAVLMLWSSPTTAKPGLPAIPLATSPRAAISSITLLLENDNANGAVFGGLATGAGGFGVVGFASATSSANFGVAGATNSSTGTGVFGLTFATTCPNVMLPVSLGQTCVGVVGQSLATSGSTAGVAGLTQSSNGAGVVGQATSGAGVAAVSVSGPGVAAVSVSGPGVSAQTTSGDGVVGVTTSGDGVRGVTTSGGGGVLGESMATSGGGFGVSGSSASPGGAGVFGRNIAASGQTFGVWGVVNSPSGVAIRGDGTNGALAGSFSGPVSISGNLSVFGNFSVTGTKSALVDTVSYGKRQLYAVESPESWFEDFGSAKLINGRAIVTLDPIFAQTVNTEDEYYIFLTPKGNCKGLYVANQRTTVFEVKELQNGNSSIAFDYRIVAKRKGYERARLPEPTK